MKRRTWWGVVVCLWLACGGSSAPRPTPTDAARDTGSSGGVKDAASTGGIDAIKTAAVRVLSVPVDDAVVGEPTRYRVVASEPMVVVQALSLPLGANLDQAGNMVWVPTADQTGDQRVAVRVRTPAGDEAEQDSTINVSAPHRERTQVVDVDAPAATTISVDAPLSTIRGAAVQIDPGSLSGISKQLSVSLSSLANPPQPPAAHIMRVPLEDLTPVDLGPTGTAFSKPVRLQLPFKASLLAMGKLSVLTRVAETGAWEKVKIVDVDEVNHLVTAEVQHFSTYVATPDVNLLDGTVKTGAAGCPQNLVVHAPLAASPASLPANLVNGYSGSAATVGDLVAALGTGQALQVYIQGHAQNHDGTASGQAWVLVSATRQAGGALQVSTTSDAGMSVSGDANPYAALAGQQANLVFPGLGGQSVTVTVDISLYLVDGASAGTPPVNAVNPVVHEVLQSDAPAAAVAGDPAYDGDCDGVPDVSDPQPQGTPPPQLVGTPVSPLHVQVGASATLNVSAGDGVTFAWAGDAALGLTTSGATATVSPTMVGSYHVDVTGTRGTLTGRVGWDVLVDGADTRTGNTPPTVQIAASASLVRVGEAVTLTAIGSDHEQVNLTFSWNAADASVLSSGGARAAFVAGAPGEYVITCIASDGLASSPPASVTLTVVPPMANRAPGAPGVTPLSAIVIRAAGDAATVTLSATSVDPDGDQVTFDFVPDPSVSRAVSLAKAGATAQVTSPVDGVFDFWVTAQDSQGATSPATRVRVQVLPAAALDRTNAVDGDQDGYPAGVDCNDANPSVFPGAREICSDGIDQDCDGRDPDASACDGDGDGYTSADGDCDDGDARRHPGMPERCDGVDNDCNGQIDEGFELGRTCAVGVGACRSEGVTRCNASFVGVACDAQPGRPSAEVCDMVDNDCNGKVDDVMINGAGTAASCGSCGVTCPQRANAGATCVMGGCLSTCAPGFVDLDRDASNGCECAISGGGKEVCDGLDNDCNGRVDDGITETVYGGPPATLGVGVCAPGVRVCRNGMLTDDKPARLPTTEVCDGLDNDCNGKVDEVFDLQNDRFNCGGCGIICGVTGKCVQGRCQGGSYDGGAPPPPDTMGVQVGICPAATGGTVCVDFLSDPQNCGGCGRACAANEFCGKGSCLTVVAGSAPPAVVHPPCPASPDAGSACPADFPDSCKDASGKIYCTNLRFDNASCGTCGKSCGPGLACRDGVCMGNGPIDAGANQPTCPVPQKVCSDPFGAQICADLSRDVFNCGGCTVVCKQGTICMGGVCTPGNGPDAGATTCPVTTATCPLATGGILCTDLGRDPMNCGACGKVCSSGNYCESGMCRAVNNPDASATACGSGLTACVPAAGITYCADLLHDPHSCGTCFFSCGATQTCLDGKCHDNASDAGTAPPPDAPVACQVPLTTCPSPTGGFCADLNSDSGNCGTCYMVCNANTKCVSGHCQSMTDAAAPPSCVQPQSACLDPNNNTYCVDLSSNQNNCGKCRSSCLATQICLNSVCACQQPLMLCQDPSGNPYCSNVSTDNFNCGVCGTICVNNTTCQQGVCQ